MRTMLHIPSSTITVRSSLLGIIALKEALEEAGIKPSDAERVVFISGITVGGMDQTELVYQKIFTTEAYNDYIDLNDCGGCTEQIADYIGGFTSVSTIVTACSSAANALIMIRFCVIIPTFNNATTVAQVVSDVLKFTSDIIVVNDGSTDLTIDQLEPFKEKIHIVSYSINRGKGYALSKGFDKAESLGYTHAITLDSDGQHFPEDMNMTV